jgi:hypothetical protein
MLDKRQDSIQKGLSNASTSFATTPIAIKYLNLPVRG